MALPRAATSPPRATVVLALALLFALALTACAGEPDAEPAALATSTPAPAPSPAPAAGVPAFLADVRGAGLGNKEVSSPGSTDPLVALGRMVCTGLDGGNSYRDAVASITGNLADVTPAQADVLVRSAIVNLCRRHEPLLP